jgi:16S rRNA (guanine966-N2)-methyltransferase
MRIIAGELKGRRIEAPRWDGLRPTSDKLRETLFNVLAPRIEAARVVDGFAGTGAVGIEALSRGATCVTFVEQDPRAVRLIQANLDRCAVAAERYAIIRANFQAPRLWGSAATADLVLLDPPYGFEPFDAACQAAEWLLARGGMLVVEHASRRAVPERSGNLQRVRVLRSGDSALSFYEIP